MLRFFAPAAFLLPALCAAPPSFYADVQPILEKNCVSCHRPGEAAPMSFLSYKEVRPYAAAIKASVAQRRMPPWNADPHVGAFANDRSLSAADIRTLTEWAANGAPAGDAKQARSYPRDFASGWTIGQPDLVIEMPETFPVPASGAIDYHYLILPTGFTEDKWVTAAETRPLNRAVNHHIIAFIREPGSKWFRGAPVGKPFVPEKDGEGGATMYLTGYAPGTVPDQLRPGQAKLIPAGSDIVFQLHWTANGQAAEDKAKLGLIFAKEPPRERVYTLQAINTKFEIPPGADNHRVDARMKLHAPARLENLIPHMHLRGKAFAMQVKYPDGQVKELLNVPQYDFNWQHTYELAAPLELPAGAEILATGWFDNSPNNRFNPDASKAVRWGDQSWEEMMIGFFNVSVPVNTSIQDLVRPARRPAANPSAGVE